jgi:transcriptional regulator with XRE-family HTH domain
MGINFIVSNCEIGAAIKRRRHELLISQEALACILEVSSQQIQRYENGMDRLNVEKLQAVAHALSVPVSYFFIRGDIENELSDGEYEELLANFRKIQNKETKTLVVEFAKKCAQWENKADAPG